MSEPLPFVVDEKSLRSLGGDLGGDAEEAPEDDERHADGELGACPGERRCLSSLSRFLEVIVKSVPNGEEEREGDCGGRTTDSFSGFVLASSLTGMSREGEEEERYVDAREEGEDLRSRTGRSVEE